MRAYQWLASVAVATAFGSPASAQFKTQFGSANNRKIVYSVVTPSSANSIATPQTGVFGGSRLTDYFHWQSPQPTSAVLGSSTFPSPQSLPGPDYLKAFGFNPGGK